ncbi:MULTISPECIES: YqgE/AlgH family protein [Vibrio]|uniref:YqgE/AlgH family protein n=1 Tax=Vibrio TaxID=662 RepID=UPI000C169057|nr:MULTISPECIES: YqgE/AlgH family protein [Vibrio]NAW69181.1 YqgE/AlgH family protein [Vibrio sp. V28_P6S34P95]NAX03734.1 YqgE/AlgH family protein [Vibrio sp. V30_P3S12P165]NAX34546.1 YqgE/AlgH family protein [Vibrio sp. V29_P1S30P107]NAX37867.1 YqgE/AlgH family protein [Vibrio sp. V27_P1S3P104]NAX39693.1 YqgE/AlgH family protein [Vibrio sp. V26_P1S5P106]
MNLTNHFLVAMPNMQDPYFKRSVIYLCEHNEEGAMGLMINAPIDITVSGMLKQVEIEPAYPQSRDQSLNKPVFNGGPISEDRGFVLHKPKDHYESTIQMTDDISVTTSKDILSVLGTDAEPNGYIVALGYAGWSPGQLEKELTENSWLTIEADADLIFDTPVHEKWHKAIKKLGIDPIQLSPQSGHA